VSLLTRFKSDEKLQAEALDILTEMIRRNLLTVSAFIDDPPVSFSCRVREAIITGSRSATQKEIIREAGSFCAAITWPVPVTLLGLPPFAYLCDETNFRLRVPPFGVLEGFGGPGPSHNPARNSGRIFSFGRGT
jgi:hypothetical protein